MHATHHTHGYEQHVGRVAVGELLCPHVHPLFANASAQWGADAGAEATRTVVYTSPGMSALVIWMKETLRWRYALLDSQREAA
jgi:hypothetical protein